MIFAYYLHDLSPFVIKFTDKIAIHWYGLAYVMGFYLTYKVMYFLAERGLSEIKKEAVADFITLVSLFGLVLGGRLGYMLLYNFDEFIHAPWTFFLRLVCVEAQDFLGRHWRLDRVRCAAGGVSGADRQLHQWGAVWPGDDGAVGREISH